MDIQQSTTRAMESLTSRIDDLERQLITEHSVLARFSAKALPLVDRIRALEEKIRIIESREPIAEYFRLGWIQQPHLFYAYAMRLGQQLELISDASQSSLPDESKAYLIGAAYDDFERAYAMLSEIEQLKDEVDPTLFSGRSARLMRKNSD